MTTQSHAALMSRLPLRRQHVTLEDLQAFLPADKAAAALATLDVDRDGAVSLHDMRDAVLQVRSRLLRLVCLISFSFHKLHRPAPAVQLQERPSTCHAGRRRRRDRLAARRAPLGAAGEAHSCSVGFRV